MAIKASGMKQTFEMEFMGEKLKIRCIRMNVPELTSYRSAITRINAAGNDTSDEEAIELMLDVIAQHITGIEGFEDEDGNRIAFPTTPNDRKQWFNEVLPPANAISLIINLITNFMQTAVVKQEDLGK